MIADAAELFHDMDLNRDRSESLVLLPTISQYARLDYVFDDDLLPAGSTIGTLLMRALD